MDLDEQLAAQVAEKTAELSAMTSDEHRAEAVRLLAVGQRRQRPAIVDQAQWHATMALVEQGRGR